MGTAMEEATRVVVTPAVAIQGVEEADIRAEEVGIRVAEDSNLEIANPRKADRLRLTILPSSTR